MQPSIPTRRTLCWLLMLLPVLAGAANRESASDIQVTGSGVLTPDWRGAPGERLLQLDLVVLGESGWQVMELPPLVQAVADIYAPCGVQLTVVRWQQLAVPEALRDFSTPAARVLVRGIDIRKPAVFLVRDTRQRPAFDAEAIGAGNSASRPELRDTVWLTRALPHPEVGLAHELFHVLINSGGHSDAPRNLMNEYAAPENRWLDSQQCAQVRESPLLQPAVSR